MGRPLRICIKGYYGRTNLGDDLMLGVLVDGLRKRYPDCTIDVFSALPERTRREYGVGVPPAFHTGRRIGVLAVLRRVWLASNYDLVILGGGTILQDLHGTGHLVEMLLMALLCRMRGRPLVLMGVGAAGLTRPLARLAVRFLLHLAGGTGVRDEESLHLLESLGPSVGKRLCLGADLVYLSPHVKAAAHAAGQAPGESSPHPYIAVSVLAVHEAVDKDSPKQRRLETRLAEVLDAVVERTGFSLVFVAAKVATGPQDVDDDRATAERVRQQMRYLDRTRVATADGELQVKIDAIGGARLAIGMRLHFALIAALLGVPTVAVSYNPKVRSFMRSTGQGRFVVDLTDEGLARLPELVVERLAQRAPSRVQVETLRRAAQRNWEVLDAVRLSGRVRREG